MVVMFGVARVLALLGVCPATHLLQAARWVPSLDQAQGLWGKQEGANNGKVKDTPDSNRALLRGRTLRPRAATPLLEITSCLPMTAAGTQSPYMHAWWALSDAHLRLHTYYFYSLQPAR